MYIVYKNDNRYNMMPNIITILKSCIPFLLIFKKNEILPVIYSILFMFMHLMVS